MCTGTPFNNGPRDMAALQSYVDASSPAAEEKWWKEAVSGKGGPEIARAVRDWRENGGMVRCCVEINQCVGCTPQFFPKSFLGNDTAVLARSSGEEPASPRHRLDANAP
jgi:hypothetical protein